MNGRRPAAADRGTASANGAHGPDGRAPAAPASHAVGELAGAARPLTRAEWEAVRRYERRHWPVQLLVVLLALAGWGATLAVTGWPPPGAPPAVWAWFGGITLGFLVIAALPLYLLLLHRPAERPGGRQRTVSRVRGLFNAVGKPVRPTVGGVWVTNGLALGYPLLAEADVEVLPSFEDDPNSRRPRLAVSADGGRWRITDAGAATPVGMWGGVAFAIATVGLIALYVLRAPAPTRGAAAAPAADSAVQLEVDTAGSRALAEQVADSLRAAEPAPPAVPNDSAPPPLDLKPLRRR